MHDVRIQLEALAEAGPQLTRTSDVIEAGAPVRGCRG